MTVFSFMQITGYSLEVNGLKQEITTHRYLRSFSCYRNDFSFPSPFELYCEILYPVKRASINVHKIGQGRQR